MVSIGWNSAAAVRRLPPVRKGEPIPVMLWVKRAFGVLSRAKLDQHPLLAEVEPLPAEGTAVRPPFDLSDKVTFPLVVTATDAGMPGGGYAYTQVRVMYATEAERKYALAFVNPNRREQLVIVIGSADEKFAAWTLHDGWVEDIVD